MPVLEIGMPKCPVCGEPLSVEGVAIGKGKGEEKAKPKLAASIMQLIGYGLESALRATVSSGRAPMLVCNNSNCPECNQLFKQGPLGVSKRWDIADIFVTFDKLGYKISNKNRKGGSKRSAPSPQPVQQTNAPQQSEEFAPAPAPSYQQYNQSVSSGKYTGRPNEFNSRR